MSVYQWIILALWVQMLWSCTPHPVYRSRDSAPRRTHVPGRDAPRPAGSRQARDYPDSLLPDPRTQPRAEERANAHPIPPADIDTTRAYQIGVASYYGRDFHGKPTASGAIYNMYRLTAAHRVLPLGTRVRVTNLTNGYWVDVKVNDRGPFIPGRVLDLSYAAALEVDMVQAGLARVMIEIIDTPD